MTIWNRVLSVLPGWPWKRKSQATTDAEGENAALQSRQTTDFHRLLRAYKHLRTLIEDTSIPASIRAELSSEFDEIQSLSEKISRQEIHIAAFGRVGVGKSSLLNALLGSQKFSVSPLHGETRHEGRTSWKDAEEQHVGAAVLIDTPGIDELGGEEREKLANRLARRSDIVMVVCEGDLTDREFESLQQLAGEKRAVILVLNKRDHYTARELELLLRRLEERCSGFLGSEYIVAVSADPRPPAGEPDVSALRALLWRILERQGKSLAALNAAIFAGELDQKVATRIVAARREVARRMIRKYCIAKGLLVAANPVPVADLLAAAGSDVAMVMHLGEVYGFRLNRRESSRLLLTISAQLAALMGAYWGANLASSLLKIASAGISATLSATAQGALAWYATQVTGEMAQTWFAKGKSWGEAGPRETAKEILAALDRDEVLRNAREELGPRIR